MFVLFLLLGIAAGLTMALPLPDAQIYFPGEDLPIDSRTSFSHNHGQTAHHSYYSRTSHTNTGEHQGPPAASSSDFIGHPYGTSGHHGPYSSYRHHASGPPLPYSSQSYGVQQHTHSHGHAPAAHAHWSSYESQSHNSAGGPTKGSSYHDLERDYREDTELNQQSVSPSHHGKQIDQGTIAEANSGTQINDGREPAQQRPTDVAAAEHHIIEQIEKLAGINSSPENATRNPIEQQQEIIREIKGLADHNQESNDNDSIRQVFQDPNEESLGPVYHETTIPPVRQYEVAEDNHRPRQTSQEHHSRSEGEIVETPILKASSQDVNLSPGHQVHSNHHASSSHKQSTPDPLDLMNIYNDYLHGDFKPGSTKETEHKSEKELKPEIKQAIDNIMREWEVLPDQEGKPVPPPRNYKITKHVKVTTTTHNRPSQTITKVLHTQLSQPSTTHHQITHHLNIAGLLEQLSQLERSPHHRNVTWCEEKIKEFLIELTRKEQSGIQINQNVQEQTLHQILTHDQTMTQQIHHGLNHEVQSEVIEEPFQKKTVVELGLNEPTRPPSYYTDEHKESTDIEEKNESGPHEIHYENVEESQNTATNPEQPKTQEEVITVTPSPHDSQQFEVLAHQHESVENVEGEVNNATELPNRKDQVSEESELEGIQVPPVQTPENPIQPGVEEFQGETKTQHRPLPPNYQPRERSEEESGHLEEEHHGIDGLAIDLPENQFTHEEEASNEIKNIEKEETSAGEVNTESPRNEHQSNSFVEKEVNTNEESHPQHEIDIGDAKGALEKQISESVQSHSGGASIVDTVKHIAGGGHHEVHEINYDQLIEELVFLESLPGHEKIEKCEEKIRQFLEVLKQQQERGFDQNKEELERLRHLIEQMQTHRQQHQENGINPQQSEVDNSFWRKVGRKIKTTFEKAKTKAHDAVNGIMHK